MKKFFTTFFVLVILAALGLFFGWAQRGVPPDAYGIIRSKTHGLDANLVKPGEFRWVWYKLIPTNVTTAIFRLNPVNHEFSAYNTLPSGNVYAAFVGINEGFSWEIRAAFSFSLQSEALIPLVTVNNIGTQEELVRYQNDIAGQIEAFILRRINTDDEFSHQIEALLKEGESPELEQEIQAHFPFITTFSFQVKSAQFPDFALYRQTKELYENYITFQKDYLSGGLQEKAYSRIESHRRFDELEQYGALLTKYPILLEYLTLEKK
jgi:hypothetical protein